MFVVVEYFQNNDHSSLFANHICKYPTIESN